MKRSTLVVHADALLILVLYDLSPTWFAWQLVNLVANCQHWRAETQLDVLIATCLALHYGHEV